MPTKSPSLSVLCYTVALDVPGCTLYRQQAQLMVSSLLRTGFAGDLKIFHNGATELFPHPKRGLEEIGLDAPEDRETFAAVKYRVRNLLDVEGYDWVLFLDCDCVVLQSLDEWFTEAVEVRYVEEAGRVMQQPWFHAYLTEGEMTGLQRTGINSGTFVVRAAHYQALMEAWEAIDARAPEREKKAWDQPAWNRLILDTKLRTSPLKQQVAIRLENPDPIHLLTYPVVHHAGACPEHKLILMRATYAAHFLNGAAGTLALTQPVHGTGYRIFVISLPRVRSRRLSAISQLLATGLEFEIVDAVDAQDMRPDRLTVPAEASPKLSQSEVACYQSHLGIYQRICDYDLSYAVVLEDDFKLNPEANLNLETLWNFFPPDADHVQLHDVGNQFYRLYKALEPGEHFNRVGPTSSGLFGYVISQRLARYVMEHYSEPLVPIDIVFMQLSGHETGFGFYDSVERIVDVDWTWPSTLEHTQLARRSSDPSTM